MPEIIVDGKSYQVAAGGNLLHACQSLKLALPYFCWHPALNSVGSCRQCAVLIYQNADDSRGRISMACMTAVTDGQRLSIKAAKVARFRELCIEATMTGHPHDCPVCEEAGECHLQDMTLLSGHINRRFEGPKRTHSNQYLGPFINHEMNRCIACYRCVRFYRDYSGGTDLNVFASRNNVFFGRAEEGVLESEFSGNLVEVCPTGVFTDKSFSQHYSRKWDLQSAPAVCVHCSVGCNIYPAERNGRLRRISNRYHPQLNGHFLCDRGRFGYEFVNHAKRNEQVWQRNQQSRSTDQLDTQQALTRLHELLATTEHAEIVAIGSSRSSLENNFSLRCLVGKGNFYSDMKSGVQGLINQLLNHYQSVQSSSDLQSLEQADCLLLIGEDVTQTAPRIALAIRQMSRNAGIKQAAALGVPYWSDAEVKNISQSLQSPLHIISHCQTKLDDIATSIDTLHPDQQVLLLDKICHYVSLATELGSENNAELSELEQRALAISKDLRHAQRPFITTGIHLAKNAAIFSATLRLSAALYQLNDKAGLICALPQANSLGLALLNDTERDIEAALLRLATHKTKTLIILETDLFRYCAAQKLQSLLECVENIIVLDHLLTATAEQADLLLPTSSFAESHGSWVNYEGRLQAGIKCFGASKQRRPAYQWLTNNTDFHSIVRDLSGQLECLQSLPSLYQKQSEDFNNARKSVRESGRTALSSYIDIKELPPDSDADSNYQHSSEGVASNIDKTQTPAYIWSPNWNSNEALNHFQNAGNGAIEGSSLGLLIFAQSASHSEAFCKVNESAQPSSATFASAVNILKVLPFHHIFSDEELSSYVSNIQQVQVRPSIRLNAQQAQSLGFVAGEPLHYRFIQDDKEDAGNNSLEEDELLPLEIDESIASGVVLLPAIIIQQQASSVENWLLLSRVATKGARHE